MKIKVNTNRMEFLRLKKRKVLAQRGHRLLQEKLEKLISEFYKLISEYKKLTDQWQSIWRQFFEDFVILKIQIGEEERGELLKEIAPNKIELETERLLNLKLPKLTFKQIERKSYSPKRFPPQWDRLLDKREEVLKALLEVSRLYLSLKLVGEEILKTRRRVNALEYILIPQIIGSIKFIDTKLTELEREFLSRLLRIKDLIRR